MKIFTQHQCPECKGEGRSLYESMNDFNPNAIQEQHRFVCTVCKGKRVIEKWMDAEEFMQTYLSDKIKLSQDEFIKTFFGKK